MRSPFRSKRLWAVLSGLGLAVAGCGAGDGVISGVGNGGNHFYSDPVLDEVVDALAASPQVARVSDDELRRAFDALRARADAGDTEAVLILYRVAARQREAAD